MEDYSQSLVDAQICQPPCPASSRQTPFKLDEGYSEETRSQDDGDSTMGAEPRSSDPIAASLSPLVGLPDAVMALTEAERSEYVYNVLRTLPTSSIAAIVERLRPLLHIDPVKVLPPETTSQIFSYLAPPMLLRASKVSRTWRERTLDSRLWRQKYVAEGWPLDLSEVTSFERSYRPQASLEKTLSRKADYRTDDRKQKKRVREVGVFTRSDVGSRESRTSSFAECEAQGWNIQEGAVEADTVEERSLQRAAEDHEMPDAPVRSEPLEPVRLDDRENTQRTPFLDDATSPTATTSAALVSQDSPESLIREPIYAIPKDSRLTYGSLLGSPRLNFQNLYKQRRKLEENWTTGRFTSFQLPHRDHPEEAHTECVYTIQYSENYLVSGSRDRTLRVWNLDTQRLIRKPLAGHNGSVLCLQFDASKAEDIIVSGSSDTDVIIWQFSTGRMIKRLQRAHGESVLNLKFDKRFLVTCSKDKTIKIWSRHELRPGDIDYPVKGVPDGGKCPAYIVDLTNLSTLMDIEANLTSKQRQPLPKYSALMTIDSHGAAVNAVHIYQDQLVSASGDRSLKVWDIHSGARNAICIGHTKGIACVQYDGRRIVSGSSDNTIRIFDAATQAEVACLIGHSKLVRTVQASFGDEPGGTDGLESQARDVDRAYFEARRSGAIPTSLARAHRTKDRNAGSSRPERIMAVGAKLPPGGGGNAWSRIISGSYDETIIVWRKTADGSWVPGLKLDQTEALSAAGGPLIARSELAQQAQRQAALQNQHTHGALVLPQPIPFNPATQPSIHQMQQIHAHMSSHQLVQQAMQTGAAALQAGLQNVAALQTQMGGNAPINPTFQPAPLHAYLQHQYQQQQAAHQQHQQQQQQQATTQNPPQVSHTLQPLQQTIPPQPVNPPHATQQLLQPQVPNHHVPLAVHAHTHTHAHGPAVHGVPRPVEHPNARVFKLQFDARRLVCCSQDPKIVGWDFTNGDEEIIECCRFFGSPT
ncbi:hypothetical protein MMC11_005467 [Xylographa trunciseda]|nr:hypothetical protein [Xylographa trunciseda]